MDIKSQATLLQTYLSQFTAMWNEEIMNEYPHTISSYPKDWIATLDSLTTEELYAVDCKQIPARIKDSSFAQFMQQLSELSQLTLIEEMPELLVEDWAFNGVKEKKRHEIQKIVPVLKKLKDQGAFKTVVDVGGGVGHLSRVLAHYHSIASISLDKNEEFQRIGKERLKKYRKLDHSADVHFLNLTFGSEDESQRKLLKNIFHKDTLTLGLHTCGPLANALIKNTIEHENAGLLSFGCCYYRLSPTSDYPLSEFYKSGHYLPLNPFSLCLATRSHAEMTFETYLTKERVKNYRYALHLFLMKNFRKNYFTEVGECNIKVYWQPFCHYIKSKLAELKIKHSFSDDDFNAFYDDEEIQRELRVMFLCNVIRWQLGRALEVYLLADRAIYLEEQGYQVEMRQYFKEALSPRNIGILALKKKKLL